MSTCNKSPKPATASASSRPQPSRIITRRGPSPIISGGGRHEPAGRSGLARRPPGRAHGRRDRRGPGATGQEHPEGPQSPGQMARDRAGSVGGPVLLAGGGDLMGTDIHCVVEIQPYDDMPSHWREVVLADSAIIDRNYDEFAHWFGVRNTRGG